MEKFFAVLLYCNFQCSPFFYLKENCDHVQNDQLLKEKLDIFYDDLVFL